MSAVDTLAERVLGSPREAIEGGGRHSDGLVHVVERTEQKVDGVVVTVDDIQRRLGNGVEIKIPARIWVAIIGSTGLVLSGLLGVIAAIMGS